MCSLGAWDGNVLSPTRNWLRDRVVTCRRIVFCVVVFGSRRFVVVMSAVSNIENYVAQQRKRLEAIRTATEKERELLERRSAAADAVRSPTVALSFRDIASPQQTTKDLPSANGKLYHSSFSARVNESSTLMDRDDLDELRQRCDASEVFLRTTREEEMAVDVSERDVDRRLARAEERKRELLSRLATLQRRERDAKDRSIQIERDEETLNREFDAERERHREAQHQRSLVSSELSEREALLVSAREKARTEAEDEQRAVERTRNQVRLAEERIRSLEMQLIAKGRTLEDFERETLRAAARQREKELLEISELRKEIERRRASLDISSSQLN